MTLKKIFRGDRRGGSSAVRKTAFFFGLTLFIVIPFVMPPLQASEDTKKSSKQKKKQELKAMEAEILAQENRLTKGRGSIREPQEVQKELESLQKELLAFPKKRRIRLGGDFDMTFDTNADRKPAGGKEEEDDTFFHLNPIVQMDLSGKRTNLQTEVRVGHQYSAKRPQIDTSNIEGTVRFGRKINRLTISLNDRLNRDAIRVEGRDNKRIRWDTSHHAALNYDLGRKFSINLENDYTRQDFPQDFFEDNSTYSFSLDPNVFYQITPKTRLSAGYNWTFNRIRQKTSDNTTHGFRVGYFGKITGKSSVSADVGINLQTPDSADSTTSRQLQSSLGYIWQISPKTSLRLLYSNAIQRAVADSVGTDELIQTTTHTVSDTVSFSLRFRLHRKVSSQFSFDGSHSSSRASTDDDPISRARTFTLPFQIAIDYDLAKWIRLRLTYTFRYQFGNEAADELRAHTWFVGTNLSF